MKIEGRIFALVAIFIGVMTPIYWFLSYDPTGTTALTLTFGLCALIAFYLIFTGRRLPERPEDRKDGEIYEGAGELGFFSPHSVWPLWVALSVALAVLGLAVGWWLFIVGAGATAITVCLFVFEYYRGVYEG
jgi:hypothetical protein